MNDCEYKLKLYYNLTNDTEIYILGIDSPSKYTLSAINVYNYGVYLSDGTLLEHYEVCKDSTILISSPIIDTEIIKFDFSKKRGQKNTLEMVLNKGWSISFRIHNANKKLDNSLKFAVKLIGNPPVLFSQFLFQE